MNDLDQIKARLQATPPDDIKASIAKRQAARATKSSSWNEAWEAARGEWGDCDREIDTCEAISSAAVVFCVKDLITPKQFDTLYGPWKSVTEASE